MVSIKQTNGRSEPPKWKEITMKRISITDSRELEKMEKEGVLCLGTRDAIQFGADIYVAIKTKLNPAQKNWDLANKAMNRFKNCDRVTVYNSKYYLTPGNQEIRVEILGYTTGFKNPTKMMNVYFQEQTGKVRK